jgi:hypothetical protein
MPAGDRKPVEIVQAGPKVRTGLDGVSGLISVPNGGSLS